MRLLFFILLFSQVLNAQEFDFFHVYQNNKAMGHFNCDQDAAGNLVIAGTIHGSVDIDPGQTVDTVNSSHPAFFIAKYSSTGDLMWSKVIQQVCWANDIHVDSDGNILLVGSFLEEVNFDPGSSDFILDTYYDDDVRYGYVLKMDPEGHPIWVESLRAPAAWCEASLVKTDEQNNVYIAGTYKDDLDLDVKPGQSYILQSPIGFDAFLAKYDSDMNIKWGESIGWTSGQTWIRDLLIDNEGGVFALGHFTGVLDFDEDDQIESMGSHDIFLARHNPVLATWDWYKTFGGVGNEQCGGMEFGRDEDEILIAGSFEGMVDFGETGVPNVLETSSKDGFFLKVDSDGSALAAKQLNAESKGIIQSIEKATNDEFIVLGAFGGSLATGNSSGNIEIFTDSLSALFIGKVNVDGELEDAFKIAESENFEYFQNSSVFINNESLLIDAENGIIATGDFFHSTKVGLGNTSLDIPKLIPGFYYNAYFFRIINYLTSTSNPKLEKQTFKIFPNPGNGHLGINKVNTHLDLNVYDKNGRRVEAIKVTGHSIDLSFLEKGLYFLEFTTNRTREVHRWIKQ